MPSSGGQTFTFIMTPDSGGTENAVVSATIPPGSLADLAGNANAASNTLQVTFNLTDPEIIPTEDTTAPVITINGSASVSIVAGSTYSDQGATCLDETNGDLTGSITTTSDINASAPGTYHVTYACTDVAGNEAEKMRTVTVTERPVKTGLDSKTWTVDEFVRIMGGTGLHDLEMVSRCDPETYLTGAGIRLHLDGLLGQASSSKSDIDVESTWVDIIGAYRLAYHGLDTGKDTITEDPIPEGLEGYGITLDQYMDAAPGDTFEYPDGNYTKAQLGGMTAWSANIKWAGEGTCTLEFRHETWVP